MTKPREKGFNILPTAHFNLNYFPLESLLLLLPNSLIYYIVLQQNVWKSRIYTSRYINSNAIISYLSILPPFRIITLLISKTIDERKI
jgi:hypothetical protein